MFSRIMPRASRTASSLPQDVAAWGHWTGTMILERDYAHLRPRGRRRRDSNRRRVDVMISRCLTRSLE